MNIANFAQIKANSIQTHISVARTPEFHLQFLRKSPVRSTHIGFYRKPYRKPQELPQIHCGCTAFSVDGLAGLPGV
jgi:hypothetical protein